MTMKKTLLPARTNITGLCLLITLLLFIACKKQPTQPDAAQGTLQGQYGQCLPSTQHGTWYNGMPANADSQYMELNVHVTSAGSYHIVSDKQNGVTFSASGTFGDTGMTTIRMKAAGTFIKPGATYYTPTFDSSQCRFYVYVQDSSGLSMADNTFTFTADGKVYNGTISGTFYPTPQAQGGYFDMRGQSLGSNPDTLLFMNVTTSDYYVDTISYPTSAPGNSFVYEPYYPEYIGTAFRADLNTAPAALDIHFRSVVTSLQPSYHTTYIATFNGTAWDSASKPHLITNARLKIVN